MSKKKKVAEGVKVVLPITPFLDMSFQLLFFFVMNFHPAAAEGQISMYLPKAPGNPDTPVVPPPFDPDKDEKKEFTIQVRSDRGAIVGLAFIDEAGRTDLGPSVEQLGAKLKSLAIPKDAKKPNIKIEAMKDLQYAQLMMVMDICIRSGFDKVGVALLSDRAAAGG